MAVAFDSSSSSFRPQGVTSSTLSFTHTPSGTPKGVAVTITYPAPESGAPDYVNAVTYGGVTLSRVVRASDIASERGAADLWFRGTGVPSGAAVVNADINSVTTTRFHITAIAMTGDSDLEVVDFDSINGDTADPSVTLAYSSRTCLAVAAHHGGAADPSAFVPNSNCTLVAQADFGASHGVVIRQTTPGNADFAIGGTASLEDAAFAAMAVSETSSAPSIGTVVHVGSSAFTLGSETTFGRIVIPITTEAGDDVFCFITSVGHDDNIAYPTCTDNDTTGNDFAVVTATPLRKGTIYWKKATDATAGKTVTVSGMLLSGAAGVSVYRNAAAGGVPVTNITHSSGTSDPEVAGFTPDTPNSMICMTVFNFQNDVAISGISCLAPPGSLSSRFQCLSTGGTDSAVIHASSGQTTGLSGTGNFRWSQGDSAWKAIAFAISSSATTVPASSTTINSGTTQNPVHSYSSAGTYTVKLIVTDNDGNKSSATTMQIHVS